MAVVAWASEVAAGKTWERKWGGVGWEGWGGKMNEGEILFPSRSAIFLLSQELSPGTCWEIHCGCLICLEKHTQAATSLPCECQSNYRTQI